MCFGGQNMEGGFYMREHIASCAFVIQKRICHTILLHGQTS